MTERPETPKLTDDAAVNAEDAGQTTQSTRDQLIKDGAAFLHDRDLLGQEWAREGIEQLKRGELVERAARAHKPH